MKKNKLIYFSEAFRVLIYSLEIIHVGAKLIEIKKICIKKSLRKCI